MLNDPAVLETEEVECDRRSGITCNALVSRMQQDEISVLERAIDGYIGGRRTRHFRGKRFHPRQTVSEARVMLYERFGEMPIDHCGVLLAEDIDQSFTS